MENHEKDIVCALEKNAELQEKIVILTSQLSASEDRATRLTSLVDEMYAYLVRIGKNKEFSLEHDLRKKAEIRRLSKNGCI